jgi:hypothetical protein
MARDYARMLCSAWADADWTGLSVEAQRFYMMVLSQADISYAGVLAYRPRRWATLAKDSTLPRIRRAIAELEAAGYLVVDKATEEMLVRTFVKHDSILKVPNVARAMVKAYRNILSPHLRDVVLGELARLYLALPETDKPKGWTVVLADRNDGGMAEDIDEALARGNV